MRNGRAFQHRIWEPAIAEIGGGVLPQAGDPGPVMLQNMLGMQAEPEPLPTPLSSAAKEVGPPGSASSKHQAERMEFCGAVKELAGSTRTGESIYLNPCFVEEVMGYEIGWTDLEP
jgi:hypothetical protein